MIPATLVLDAGMTAKDVRARLAPSTVIAGVKRAAGAPGDTGRHDEAAIVIRRRHDGDILWYVRTVAEVRAALAGAKASDTLTELLDLHEHQRATTRELRALREGGEGRFTGVVLDGDRVVGVVRKPEPGAPPSPPTAMGRGPSTRGGGFARRIEKAAPPAHRRNEEKETRGRSGGAQGAAWDSGLSGGISPGGSGGGSAGGSGSGSRGGGGASRGHGFESLSSERGGGGGRRVGAGSGPQTASRGERGAHGEAGGGGGGPSGAEPPRPRAANGGGRGTRPRPPAGNDSGRAATPQRAFPLLKAPDLVKSRADFTLTVGLSKAPVKGVTGDAMTINVPVAEETIDLDVQVSAAPGFKAPEGWRHTLTLKTSNIYKARLEIPLTAPEVTSESLLSVLSLHFSHVGVHLGTATRRIEVARTIRKGKPASPWVRATPRPAAMTMDLAERAPDLTIRIEKPDANEATGAFVWTFESPHQVRLPAKPLPMNLGTDAKTFAKAMITLIDENQGGQLLTSTVRGMGIRISQKIPADVWRVLADVAAEVDAAARGERRRPVTLLLYSAETSVPWELAVMPKPLDPQKPEYLGAQVALGRWILGNTGPTVPPARAVAIERMAIVTGYYKAGSELSRLKGAEEESKHLQTTYGALGLDATPENVRQLFEGTIANAEDIHAIHFACHGEVQPASPELNAIFLSDGSPLNEFVFLGARIGATAKPILFLNACQVGMQGEMLGESAGFGAGCLYAGFRAFVAPLWSIDDATAREVALDFYRTAFDTEALTWVSSFFKDTRCKFAPASSTDVPDSTYLAYVYYGHPELMLSM